MDAATRAVEQRIQDRRALLELRLRAAIQDMTEMAREAESLTPNWVTSRHLVRARDEIGGALTLVIAAQPKET